jgi:hypothetical protein
MNKAYQNYINDIHNNNKLMNNQIIFEKNNFLNAYNENKNQLNHDILKLLKINNLEGYGNRFKDFSIETIEGLIEKDLDHLNIKNISGTIIFF